MPLSGAAAVVLAAAVAWAALVAAAGLAARRLRPAGSIVQVELQWWRVDVHVASASPGGLAPIARTLRLRNWFDLGVVASLALGLYACVLLATEAAVLVGRLGLLPLATPQGAQGAHLQLAVPGVTLPASHLVYIWAAVLASLVVHEAGHALAAAAEGLPVGSVGLVLTLFLPSAYVLLDEADLARLGRWRVLRVACAGAWHNTMLSALCWAGAAGLAAAWRAGAAALQPPPAPLLVLHRLLGYTGSVSAALGLLNMAPVHFLDGEKALCALLGGDDAGGALPQAQRPQPAGGPRALRRLTPYVRRLAARWLLHAGTALLVTVAVLHVACLQWCAH